MPSEQQPKPAETEVQAAMKWFRNDNHAYVVDAVSHWRHGRTLARRVEELEAEKEQLCQERDGWVNSHGRMTFALETIARVYPPCSETWLSHDSGQQFGEDVAAAIQFMRAQLASAERVIDAIPQHWHGPVADAAVVHRSKYPKEATDERSS